MKRHLCLALICIIPCIPLWRVVFAAQSLSGGDLVNQYIPYKNLIVDQIKQGEFPHWNPLTFSGRPLQADIQTGVFYPPNALFLILPAHKAFDVLTVLHFVLLGIGAYVFFRKMLENDTCAFLSAITFSIAGFFATQLHSGIVLFIFTGAWLPWMLWAAERGIAERDSRGYLWLATFGALQLLAGAPQIAFYSWLITGVYLLVAMRMEYGGRNAFGISSAGWLAAGGIFAATLMTILLTAVQWMPTQEFLSLSFERGQGASYEYVTDGSLEWDWLPTFLAPFIFGHPSDESTYWGSAVGFWEFNGYVGVLPFILAIVGLLSLGRSAPPKDRRLAFFGLICLILWLCLAPGKNSPIFKVAYYVIPGFDRFRVPARWVLAYQLGMAVFAGLGLKQIISASSRKPMLIVIGILVVFVVAAGILNGFRDPLVLAIAQVRGLSTIPNEVLDIYAAQFASAMRMFLILAVAALILALAFLSDKKPLFVVLLIALVVADLVYFGSGLVKCEPSKGFFAQFYPSTTLVNDLQQGLKDGQRFTWDDSVFDWTVDQNQEEIYPNRPMMHGLATVRGYDPVNSLRYGQYMNALAGMPLDEAPRAFMFMPYPAHPRLLAMLNTEAILSYQDLPQETFHQSNTYNFQRDFLTHKAPAQMYFYAGEKPLGEAFLARPELLTDEEADNPEWVLARLVSPDFDWRTTALVEAEELPFLEKEASQPRSAERVRRSASSRVFRVSTDETSALVLSESYYPGWRARVDGREQPAFPANRALIGTFVGPGEHEVEFYYLPTPFVRGLIVSCFAIGLLFVLALLARRFNT